MILELLPVFLNTVFFGFINKNYIKTWKIYSMYLLLKTDKNGGKVQKHTRHRFAPFGGKIFISTGIFI